MILALSDATLLTALGMVLAWGSSVVALILKSRKEKADYKDALLSMARAAAGDAHDFDYLTRLKRRAEEASSRAGAKKPLDQTMRIVISESQMWEAHQMRSKDG